MTFSEILTTKQHFPVSDFCDSVEPHTVERVLQKQSMTCDDLLVLCSEAADGYLEIMARKAAAITRRHFGSTMTLFTPLYIANYCQNSCPYCSFAHHVSIDRRQLTNDEVEAEACAIAASGLRHILVLTGEAPGRTTFSYIKESCATIARYFSAVGIEMYPLTEDQYGELIDSGYIDSLTIYQETYNEKLYTELHRKGPKKDFHFRLETVDRACRRHIRAVTIGALLGLDDFRREVYATALHLLYLQKTYPAVELAVSFPRIRPLATDFVPQFPVTDRQLVRIITAFRILFPTVGITLSTRESAQFRDGVMSLGITKMSAGVSTAVGGHSEKPSTTQFEIADARSVEEMKVDLLKGGFQPVTHDWNMKMSAGIGK